MSNAFVSFSQELGEHAVHDEVYEEPEDLLEIEVCNPITHGHGTNKYTDYEIVCRTNIPCFKKRESRVRRRFSDFVKLKKLLESDNKRVVVPPLPESGLLTYKKRFSESFIEERRVGLEHFAQVVASHPLLQTGSRTMVSFMQDEIWQNSD